MWKVIINPVIADLLTGPIPRNQLILHEMAAGLHAPAPLRSGASKK